MPGVTYYAFLHVAQASTSVTLDKAGIAIPIPLLVNINSLTSSNGSKRQFFCENTSRVNSGIDVRHNFYNETRGNYIAAKTFKDTY